MTVPDLPEDVADNSASSVLSPASFVREYSDQDISSEGFPSGEASLATELILRPQSLTNKGKQCLGDMSDDLWNCILDNIPSPPWLYRVLQLSKRFHKLVLPRLYKRISFHLDFPTPYLIQGLFDVDNPGLPYIRELSLTPNRKGPSMASDLMVSMFVSLLPRDVLRYFFWNGETSILESTCINLWERQRKLLNIELLPRANLEDTFLNTHAILTSLKSLKQLRLVPDRTSHWETGAMVLSSSKYIDSMVLDLWDKERAAEFSEDFDAAVNSYSLETEKFFADFAATPLSLTKLELRTVNLHKSTHAIISALSLATLKDLGLHRCEGADVFLTSLSRSKHTPRLRTLRINHLKRETPDTMVTAIEDYLICTPSCLLTLTIVLRGYTVQPKVSSIVYHGSTLEHLFLDVRTYTDRIFDDHDCAVLYPHSELRIFFSNLPRLTQLAMAFPKVIADGSNRESADDDFSAQLVSNPSLITLNITTYPFPIGTPTDPNDNFASPDSVHPEAHDALLACLANVVHTNGLIYHDDHYHRQSPLRTVVFGIAERGHVRSALKSIKDLRPAYFTRLDLWGWRKGVRKGMEMVALRLLEMEGQEVDVLMERVDDRVDREVLGREWWCQ